MIVSYYKLRTLYYERTDSYFTVAYSGGLNTHNSFEYHKFLDNYLTYDAWHILRNLGSCGNKIFLLFVEGLNLLSVGGEIVSSFWQNCGYIYL